MTQISFIPVVRLFNFRLILLMIILAMCITPVSAEVIITNTISQSTINWQWSGTESGISNLTIDGYEVCGASSSLTSFLLTGLDPFTTHEINVTYLGESTLQSSTTLNATSGGTSPSGGGDGGAAGAAFGLVGGLIGALLAVGYLKRERT